MIWRRATIILLGLVVGLSAWMYLRDRGSYAVPTTPRAQAERDADHLLDLLAPSGVCADRCDARALGRSGPGQWRVQLRTPAWRRCFLVRLNQFEYGKQTGMTGLRSIGCG
jgi:hypothetical protein